MPLDSDGVSEKGPEGDPLQDAYEVLREIRDTVQRNINAHLSAAGFDNISENALLILCAINFAGAAAPALIRRLGMQGPTASEPIEALIQSKYMDFLVNPDDPRKVTIVLTNRGRAALHIVTSCLHIDRLAQFPRRPGDIIISTQPKSGTTWVQMICALLIFQTPELPASLPELSPLLDVVAAGSSGRADFYARLTAQRHRRFIKTHLRLDQLPADPHVTYIVIARHPLDSAISMYHQNASLLSSDNPQRPNETARQRLVGWIDELGAERDSYLGGALERLSYVWEHRAEPNVVLLHYEDLSADLAAEMRRLASRLQITVPEDKWPSLVEAATFERMKAAADQLRPLEGNGINDAAKERAAFFRRGSSGEGRALLTDEEVARYYACAAKLAPQELLAWLHRDDKRLPDSQSGRSASRSPSKRAAGPGQRPTAVLLDKRAVGKWRERGLTPVALP
ncbi:MAG: sulfotransferase domain-containing protein [Acidobacteriaceae bacterium]